MYLFNGRIKLTACKTPELCSSGANVITAFLPFFDARSQLPPAQRHKLLALERAPAGPEWSLVSEYVPEWWSMLSPERSSKMASIFISYPEYLHLGLAVQVTRLPPTKHSSYAVNHSL